MRHLFEYVDLNLMYFQLCEHGFFGLLNAHGSHILITHDIIRYRMPMVPEHQEENFPASNRNATARCVS